MSAQTLGDALIDWARRERAITGLVMIGSRVRSRDQPDAADEFSDWDFQVITSRPIVFRGSAWLKEAGLPSPEAYVFRAGRLGQAPKASIVFAGGEMDVVTVPAARLTLAKWLVRLGSIDAMPGARAGLAGLAAVLRGGYRIHKGERMWGGFLARVASDFAAESPSDAEVCGLADGFVVDYVSTLRKIQRGEFIAAQRWLHHHLAETNFQLLGVLEQRAGRLALPDARRIERMISERWRGAVLVSATPDRASLERGVEQSAETLRVLMHTLVGERWQWPKLSLRLRRE